MIAKTRDAAPELIRQLEREAEHEHDPIRRAALQGRAARLRADSTSEEACALIDRHLESAGEWAVLHDLHLSVGTFTVRLNHLLVSDRLECVCVDTRYLRHGLEMDASGVMRAYSATGTRVIASPLAKAARDVRLLGALLSEAHLLPRRFGIGPRTATRGIVLTNPALRIGLPAEQGRATIGVFPADALCSLLWQRSRGARPAERLSRRGFERLCGRIAALHRPTVPRGLLEAAREAA